MWVRMSLRSLAMIAWMAASVVLASVVISTVLAESRASEAATSALACCAAHPASMTAWAGEVSSPSRWECRSQTAEGGSLLDILDEVEVRVRLGVGVVPGGINLSLGNRISGHPVCLGGSIGGVGLNLSVGQVGVGPRVGIGLGLLGRGGADEPGGVGGSVGLGPGEVSIGIGEGLRRIRVGLGGVPTPRPDWIPSPESVAKSPRCRTSATKSSKATHAVMACSASTST